MELSWTERAFVKYQVMYILVFTPGFPYLLAKRKWRSSILCIGYPFAWLQRPACVSSLGSVHQREYLFPLVACMERKWLCWR